jgi:hypothetical protein
MKTMRRAISVGGAVILGWSVMAGVATAKPIEHEHFEDVSSTVLEGFCGDLTVREDVNVTGMFQVNTRGPDGLPFFKEVSRGTVSWTNLANNKTFTSVFSVNDKDLKVIDNGDGTLTLLVLETGGAKIYGPEGKLFSNTGQVRYELLIDHGGTPTDPSDDEILEFLGTVKESTGTNDTEGRDFCADIHEFIG